MATMTVIPNAEEQAKFYAQYELVRRDEVVGVLLAFFLGTFGAHHFYLKRTGLGILYCCLSIFGISTILGFIECFFMPGRVRHFNMWQASVIAAGLGIAPPSAFYPVPMGVPAGAVPVPQGPIPANPVASLATSAYCPGCGKAVQASGVRFCANCGAAL